MHQPLADLAGRYWNAVLDFYPLRASIIGDHRGADRWTDPSREAEDRFIGDLEDIVARTEAIPDSGLAPDEAITKAVLIFEAGHMARELGHRYLEHAVDPMSGVHMDIVGFIPQLRLIDLDHGEALLARAERTDRLFAGHAERLRQGLASGRTPPRVSVEKVIGQLEAWLATPPADDPFLLVQPPPGLVDVDRWRERLLTRVVDSVRPGVRQYLDFVRDRVLPKSRPPERSGIMWTTDGEAAYADAIAKFTSLDLSPAEVHEIGLEEIAVLESEYAGRGSVVLGTADVPDIYERLRNDPSLRFENADQVRAAAERCVASATEAIPQWFGRLPQAPCVVEPIPEVAAPDSTIAYYLQPSPDGSRPGTYFINLHQPTTRTRFEAEALGFHEAVPGHHLQLAIAQELEGIATFRKHARATVYVEGWGLYTERLSDEMGIYSDELSRMGILSFDSWRACRLVVDTGMHALGWGRQEAIDYMFANSPQAPNNIVNEVDRYIGWPGQAVAYKTGQREIVRLRRSAETTLGSAFDIREFHDTVLGSGPVPLSVLEDLVTRWVSARQNPPAPDSI